MKDVVSVQIIAGVVLSAILYDVVKFHLLPASSEPLSDVRNLNGYSHTA